MSSKLLTQVRYDIDRTLIVDARLQPEKTKLSSTGATITLFLPEAGKAKVDEVNAAFQAAKEPLSCPIVIDSYKVARYLFVNNIQNLARRITKAQMIREMHKIELPMYDGKRIVWEDFQVKQMKALKMMTEFEGFEVKQICVIVGVQPATLKQWQKLRKFSLVYDALLTWVRNHKVRAASLDAFFRQIRGKNPDTRLILAGMISSGDLAKDGAIKPEKKEENVRNRQLEDDVARKLAGVKDTDELLLILARGFTAESGLDVAKPAAEPAPARAKKKSAPAPARAQVRVEDV